MLLCGLWGVAQTPQALPEDSTADASATILDVTGYLEGRIVSIDTSEQQALVDVDGELINALLGTPVIDDGQSNVPTFQVGDRVELYYAPNPANVREYVVIDWVRRPALLWLTGLFLATSVVVARLKGLRAFVATGCSLLIVTWFIIPQILQGSNPVWVSLVGVGGMLILAIFFVHGLSWSTTAALLGTFVAVLMTMSLGLVFSEWARLTGFGSEEAMMINIGASQVQLRGLLLAGLLVGALGALTDITIVQASVVRELSLVNPSFGWLELYQRGMNVGFDHIGSLVNTLVLAYTGSSLPLLVLLQLSDFGALRALNFELVASEIVHTLVGSIGLVLAVPITTVTAALMFRGNRLPIQQQELNLHGHGAVDQTTVRRQLDVLASLNMSQDRPSQDNP
ncbi:MAG: YibE/F family protein [Deinococcota bacterium]